MLRQLNKKAIFRFVSLVVVGTFIFSNIASASIVSSSDLRPKAGEERKAQDSIKEDLAYALGYKSGQELDRAVDAAKNTVVRPAFDDKKTAFVIAGHGKRDIVEQIELYDQWRQKKRDKRGLTEKEKNALMKALIKARDFIEDNDYLVQNMDSTLYNRLIKETRWVAILDDEAINLDANGELILRGNPALVNEPNSPFHKAVFIYGGRHKYDEWYGSELEKSGKMPRTDYFTLSQILAMRERNELESWRLLLGHEDNDFLVGRHLAPTEEVDRKIASPLKRIYGNYLKRQKARFEMEWLPKGQKVTTSTIPFSVGGWAGQNAVHPSVKEAVEEALIEAVETGKIRSYSISTAGSYIIPIVTHLKGTDSGSLERLAEKIYAKAREVAKELNLTPPVKRTLSKGEYAKNYMLTEMEISERVSEPLLVFTSTALPGYHNAMLLDIFLNEKNSYGIVIDPNMLGGFSFEVLDRETGKTTRLNAAIGEERQFLLSIALTQPFKNVITKVFPNAAPTLPKNLSPNEAVAVASFITLPNQQQVSVVMVRSQSGLPAVGEVVEYTGKGKPLATGEGFYRGLFPAAQTDSATLGLVPKITCWGFQLAQGYLQEPRDPFSDISYDSSRKKALEASEKLARMGVIQPGAIPFVPEEVLKVLDKRWIKLPEKSDIYQSKPSKTGKPKITLSLIKADVGGWVGHTDVHPRVLQTAKNLLQYAMGLLSPQIVQKIDVRQYFAKVIEMETRKAEDGSLDQKTRDKAKAELVNINAAIDFIMTHPGLLEDAYVTDGGDDLELIMRHRRGVNNANIHTLALNTLYLCGKLAEYHKQYNFLQDLLVDVSKFTGTVQGMGPGVAELDVEENEFATVLALMMDKTSAAAFSKFMPEAFRNFYHAATVQGPEKVGYRGYVMELWDVKEHKAIYLDIQTEMNFIEALLHDTEGYWIKRIYPIKKGYWSLQGTKLVEDDGRVLTLADIIDDDPIGVFSTEKLFAIGGGAYKGKDDPVGLLVEQPVFKYLPEALKGLIVPGGLRGSTNAGLMPVSSKDAHPTRLDQPPRLVGKSFNLAKGQLGKPLDFFADPIFDEHRRIAMEIYDLIRDMGPTPPSLVLHPEYTTLPNVLKEMAARKLWQEQADLQQIQERRVNLAAFAVTTGIDFQVPDSVVGRHTEGKEVYPILISHESLLKTLNGVMSLESFFDQLGKGNIKVIVHINRDDITPTEIEEILQKDLETINKKLTAGYDRITRDMLIPVVGTDPVKVAAQVKEKVGADAFQVWGPENYVKQFKDLIKVRIILDQAGSGQLTLMSKAFKLGLNLIPADGKMSDADVKKIDALFRVDGEGNFHVGPTNVVASTETTAKQYEEQAVTELGI